MNPAHKAVNSIEFKDCVQLGRCGYTVSDQQEGDASYIFEKVMKKEQKKEMKKRIKKRGEKKEERERQTYHLVGETDIQLATTQETMYVQCQK